MSYTIERLEDNEAYIVILNEDFDTETEIQEYYDAMTELLNSETGKVAIIMDVTYVKTSLDTLMHGTKSALKATNNPNNHVVVHQLILVTNNMLVKHSIEGFRKLGVARNIKGATSIEAAMAML